MPDLVEAEPDVRLFLSLGLRGLLVWPRLLLSKEAVLSCLDSIELMPVLPSLFLARGEGFGWVC